MFFSRSLYNKYGSKADSTEVLSDLTPELPSYRSTQHRNHVVSY